MSRWLVLLVLILPATSSLALEVVFKPIADGVWVHIGDKGPRSAANEGLNANLGLVATGAGAVLIDSGATFRSARKIDAAVGRVTAQPVRWVINTGSQDHRWLGNGYFRSQGAEIIGHVTGSADMQARGGDQLALLRSVLGDEVDGTIPTLPARLLKDADTKLELGGTAFEFRHRGGGHTPGDMVIWLPKANVLFAGDIVYTDRLLAVLPVSSTRRWLDTFAEIERLEPSRIVPGHGEVTDLATARLHTRDYLRALRAHMKRAVESSTEIGAAVRSFSGSSFMHLLNASELMGVNANRVYLELELE